MYTLLSGSHSLVLVIVVRDPEVVLLLAVYTAFPFSFSLLQDWSLKENNNNNNNCYQINKIKRLESQLNNANGIEEKLVVKRYNQMYRKKEQRVVVYQLKKKRN